MNQKKKPILLISIVGTLVLVVVVGNLSEYLRNQDKYQAIDAPNKETMEKLAGRSNQAAADGGAILGTMEKAMTPGAVGGQLTIGDVPPTPSIILPNIKNYRETYEGPHKTTGQWFRDSSYQQTEIESRKDKSEDD